jgi:hypothetical protein
VKLAITQWNLVNKKTTWRDSAPIDMFLSAVSVLVVVQLSCSEVPEGLMNNPVLWDHRHICGPSLTETLLRCANLYWYIKGREGPGAG